MFCFIWHYNFRGLLSTPIHRSKKYLGEKKLDIQLNMTYVHNFGLHKGDAFSIEISISSNTN